MKWSIFRRTYLRVLPCRRTKKQCRLGIAPSQAMVLPCLLRERIQTISDFPPRAFFLLVVHSRLVHPKCTRSTRGVGSSRSTCFLHLSHIGLRCFFFPPVIEHICRDEQTFFAVHEQAFALSAKFLRVRSFRIVAQTIIVRLDVRTDVFQVIPQDLLFFIP